ncbi:heavy-metal-associated domain-containing protein [Caldanaerobius polysaccharolyticus]|uniref:heavy-metal-associated domain-containing protein n=1 Tax=Caldanaerobius polysaccharolyticus TaxID=44256 RepID=UPI00047C27BB|nr:copper ion binding protein [Caldanaerobius polysaccharolyticus]
MKKQFSVPSMSCQHCVMAITNSLKQLKGVQDVTVDLDKKTVDVDYDENIVTESAMINAIEEVGYDVE